MKSMYLNRAVAKAVAEEMARDDRVILLGEDVLKKGGGTGMCIGVPEKYPDNCFDMPLEELGYSYFAVGAALAGYRPIVDLMYAGFSALALDAIVNSAARMRYYTLGGVSVPSVFLLGNGGKGVYGAFGNGGSHSECVESWFTNIPGLKIVAPYYARDAYGLMKASIRDDDPVVFFYPVSSIGKSTPMPEEEYIIPLTDAANILEEGTDVTIVAIQSMVPIALDAAEELKAVDISCEVIDPRVLIPLDEKTICNSVKKTGRVIIMHEAGERGGYGGEIASVIAEKCIPGLKAPVKRLCSLNCTPPAGYGETLMKPHKEDVILLAQELMKY